MKERVSYYILFLIIPCLIGCASSGTLSGGPKDVIAPKVILEKSSNQLKLASKDRSFNFVFDEFIEVKNTLKEVQVSPPLVYIPKVKSRGKELVFEFNEKEVLKDSTTYIINFGESIVDYREGNVLKNFTYVFSTGNVIDSFELEGNISSLDKEENTIYTVMLYNDFSDTIMTKKKPYYSSKTNTDGSYSIKNIKKGSYQIVAIKDENNNFIWDEATEKIGFVTNAIQWDTSIVASQDLFVSKPEPLPKVVGKTTDKNFGITKIKMNAPFSITPEYSFSSKMDKSYLEIKEDSLVLWYDHGSRVDSVSWYLPFDTIKINPNKTVKPIDTMIIFSNTNLLNIKSTDTIFIQSSTPIETIDATKISIKDSLSDIKLITGKILPKTMYVVAAMNPKKSYDFKLDPGALIDWYGNRNDTLKTSIQTVENKTLSEIILDIQDLDSTQTYEVSLLKSGQIFSRQNIVKKSGALLKFKQLVSDEYSVELIEDKNLNGKFDPSSFRKKRQSETRKEVKLDRLKTNWKQETIIKFKD
jgi:uncharacterized protein (DUF2141 family)